ncbi:acetyltransferase [Corynebacterium phocae]|uniref:Acetyltransferase n=1 Tax=Corynebacterium phocae TaxID=161895 RepID=A0A1L7D0C5_9CORY|nr:GNAT family N-acetyltransferase [Corynebacterium phocae]APT91595.1 acetyltransferase [Corynebacterium phocae]KAA8720664.1 GNAT family N-acetyltransferase [Corynebacterium phocae]
MTDFQETHETEETSIQLRATSESDRTYIARLNFLTEVFGDETAPTGDNFGKDSVYYMEQWTPENNGFIAWDGYVPAGGVWLRQGTADNHGWGHVSEDIPELAIAVESRYEGQGLGGALLDAATELARSKGAPGISLCVNKKNARAHELYKRIGFEEVNETDRFHILMKRF